MQATFALLAALALFIFWCKHLKSGLRGFALVVVGWSAIFALYKADGEVSRMIDNVVVVVVVSGLVALLMALRSARRKNRVHVYVPKDQRGASKKPTKPVSKKVA